MICECGCGATIPDINKRGERARFKHGHNYRGQVGTREQRQVGYRALHQRIERRRGTASDYDCRVCGDQARTWALDHDSQTENLRVDDHTSMAGLVFSLDLDDYRPLCQRCNALEGSPRVAGMANRLLDMGRTSLVAA